MLVLSRKRMEKIRIGRHITVSVLRLSDGRVRLGIEAPQEVHILRGELEEGDKPQQPPRAA